MIGFIFIKILGGFWAVKNKAQYSRVPLIRKLYRLLYDVFLYENGSYIDCRTQFLGPPIFPHGVRSVFISGDAVIGRNCVIFQQTTIGSNTLADSKGKGAPVIGDDCYIGAGAKIIGNVRIGNHCRIGANAIVVTDIPENSLVVLQKPNILTRETRLRNRYYKRPNGIWHSVYNGVEVRETDPEVLAMLSDYS